jgi:hypothetical protein
LDLSLFFIFPLQFFVPSSDTFALAYIYVHCSTAAAQAAIERGIARSEAKYALRLERRAAEEALSAAAGGSGGDGDEDGADDEDEDELVDDDQDEDEKREQDAMLADEANAAAAADSAAASVSASSSSSSSAAATGEVFGRVLTAHEEQMRDRYLRDTESVRERLRISLRWFRAYSLFLSLRLSFRLLALSVLNVCLTRITFNVFCV